MDLFSFVMILLISTLLGTLLGSAIKDFKRERYTMFGITITMWLVWTLSIAHLVKLYFFV